MSNRLFIMRDSLDVFAGKVERIDLDKEIVTAKLMSIPQSKFDKGEAITVGQDGELVEVEVKLAKNLLIKQGDGLWGRTCARQEQRIKLLARAMQLIAKNEYNRDDIAYCAVAESCIKELELTNW